MKTNMGDLSMKEYKILADLRMKLVSKFIDDLNESNDILEIIISRKLPGGVRCYFNMQAAFSALFIFYINMLENKVPNDILEKVFLDLAEDVVKRSRNIAKEL